MTSQVEDYPDFDEINNQRLQKLGELINRLELLACEASEDYADRISNGCLRVSGATELLGTLESSVLFEAKRESHLVADSEAGCLADECTEVYQIDSAVQKIGLDFRTMPAEIVNFLTLGDEDIEPEYDAEMLEDPDMKYAIGIVQSYVVTSLGAFSVKNVINLYIDNETEECEMADVVELSPELIALALQEPQPEGGQTDALFAAIFDSGELDDLASFIYKAEYDKNAMIALKQFVDRLPSIQGTTQVMEFERVFKIAEQALRPAI